MAVTGGVVARMAVRATSSRAVDELLAQLPAIAQGTLIETALVAGALVVANKAKTKAPVLTGTLRRSIHVGGYTHLTPDFEKDSDKYDDIHGNRHDATSAQVVVGTDVPYAFRIEFGFVGTDSLGRTYDQEPRQYMRPAFDESQDEVENEVGRALQMLLRRELER